MEEAQEVQEAEEVGGVSTNLLVGLGIFFVVLFGLIFLVIVFFVMKTYRARVKDACERQYHALR